MNTFKIEIKELLARVVEVQAKNIQEAFSKVKDQYVKAQIVLDYNDFAAVNFTDINNQSKRDEINMLIKGIIDYLYVDEQKHFEESNNPKNHIFQKLERLQSLID
ncbi:MAG: DpnD/PcfM family protein [Bacteroidales bacterium]|nr:DpnD/PcfM family protein [Bacteroidales bacterium]